MCTNISPTVGGVVDTKKGVWRMVASREEMVLKERLGALYRHLWKGDGARAKCHYWDEHWDGPEDPLSTATYLTCHKSLKRTTVANLPFIRYQQVSKDVSLHFH